MAHFSLSARTLPQLKHRVAAHVATIEEKTDRLSRDLARRRKALAAKEITERENVIRFRRISLIQQRAIVIALGDKH